MLLVSNGDQVSGHAYVGMKERLDVPIIVEGISHPKWFAYTIRACSAFVAPLSRSLPLYLGTGRQERADGEMMRSVIGRLSVLLLDGYLDEAEANPDISGRGEEYQ